MLGVGLGALRGWGRMPEEELELEFPGHRQGALEGRQDEMVRPVIGSAWNLGVSHQTGIGWSWWREHWKSLGSKAGAVCPPLENVVF